MWTYKGKEVSDEDVEGYVAFVYKITNLETGRKYIGKKNLFFTRSKKVKGKSRRKRERKVSDWRVYWGSNDSLIDDVADLGEDKFKREILHFCKTKGTANYLEMKEQIINEVLENDGWYNDQIRVRVHRSHLKDLKTCFK